MPKVNIYVQDDLYDELRRHELPISSIAQEAFRRALRAHSNADWLERARVRGTRATAAVNTSDLMTDIREEFGT